MCLYISFSIFCGAQSFLSKLAQVQVPHTDGVGTASSVLLQSQIQCLIIFVELHLVDAPAAVVEHTVFIYFLKALATYSEGMPGCEVIFS